MALTRVTQGRALGLVYLFLALTSNDMFQLSRDCCEFVYNHPRCGQSVLRSGFTVTRELLNYELSAVICGGGGMLTAGSLVQQENGTPHFSRLGLESVQLK